MKYAIIVGSHRGGSQSTKVGKYIQHQINILNETEECFLIDLRNNPLPLRNDYMWNPQSDEYKKTMEVFGPIQEQLEQVDGLVFVSPERAGMAAPGLKNFFLYCSSNVIGNKPALAVGVSSGINGAYPIAELHVSSNKNAQFYYIPQHVIVRNVENILNSNDIDENQERDASAKKRIIYSIKMLEQYAKASKLVRASGVADFDTYAYGM